MSDPTGTISSTPNQAGTLVAKALDAYSRAPGGFASQKLGRFTPGLDAGASGSFNCPGGGTVVFAPASAGAGSYAYSGCVIEGVTYNGAGAVSYSMSGSALQTVTIAQRSVTAVVEGVTIPLDDRVVCNAAGSAMICVGHYGNNAWGNDISYGGGIANGSYQCECATERWNSTLHAFTATGGSVDTVAAVGSATIVRTGANTFTVTIGANTYQISI